MLSNTYSYEVALNI